MVRDGAHPLAIFSLVPANNRALEILNHGPNAHRVSAFEDPRDMGRFCGLDIGHVRSRSRFTLATIGRCGDITVPGQSTSVSRIQCSFEIHEQNHEIMLHDRSLNRSTQFFGKTAIPFETGRPCRRVVVDPTVNLEFGFGGATCDLYQFRIFWHESSPDIHIDPREEDPREARTVLDEPPTVAPSRPMTRIHTPGLVERIRYSKRDKIGSGTFGEVWKVANIDSGDYMAVKRIQRPALMTRQYVLLKREVETLSRLSHKNIIELKAAQWAEDHFDIVMELKPANVEGLIDNNIYIREPRRASSLLHQMLQALDYLAYNGIVHRDVKPANILCAPLPTGGDYEYQLADFGLANVIIDARTWAGTTVFMAPELDERPPPPQTSKMDVWSLFVTLTYAMDVGGFRRKALHTTELRIRAVEEAADEQVFWQLREMAIVDPAERATAAHMLSKLYAGEGRTTPVAAAPERRVERENVANGRRSGRPANTEADRPSVETTARERRPRVAGRVIDDGYSQHQRLSRQRRQATREGRGRREGMGEDGRGRARTGEDGREWARTGEDGRRRVMMGDNGDDGRQWRR